MFYQSILRELNYISNMTHILNASYERLLDIKCDQPADEQNIPVLRTRNANIKRPTCKPNFLQTALCHKYHQFCSDRITENSQVKALRE